MKRVLGLSLVTFCSLALAQFTPDNPECIAPAAPGGGYDFTCRVPAAQVMPEIGVVDNLRVTNVEGAGGGVAFSNVVSQRAADNNLIVAASTGAATRLAQNAYAGFTADDVRWLGAVGADYGILAVATDSDLTNLEDLVTRMREDPGSLTFVGGSAVGGFDNIKPLLVAKAAGVEDISQFTYVAFEGGGPALIEVKAGRADVFAGDTSEILGELDAGNVRILAVLAPERVERLGDTMTAVEQGYDVIAPNWRGFYAPPEMSDEAYAYWVDAVQQVADSEAWASLREQNGLAPFESFGDEFDTFVKEQVAELADISREIGIIE